MTITTKIRDFVESECKKPTSKYGYEPFPYHFVPVVKYALKLADQLGGDKEIIEIAGWLHDIGSIICGREDHHKTGAQIAEKKLNELNYPKDKIALVKKCILHHRGSQGMKIETIEEKILVEADTMSNFDNISGILKAALVYEKLDQNEARLSALKKIENKWRQLSFPESKKLLRPKYEALKLVLQDY